MTAADRRCLAIAGGRTFIVSQSSEQILRLLRKERTVSYGRLQHKTGIPLSSLYVFVSRLRRCKLVVATGPSSDRLLALVGPVTLSPARYIG